MIPATTARVLRTRTLDTGCKQRNDAFFLFKLLALRWLLRPSKQSYMKFILILCITSIFLPIRLRRYCLQTNKTFYVMFCGGFRDFRDKDQEILRQVLLSLNDGNIIDRKTPTIIIKISFCNSGFCCFLFFVFHLKSVGLFSY